MTEFEDDKSWLVRVDGVPHLVGRNHIGMTCHMCGESQTGHKVYEDQDEAVIVYEHNGKPINIPRHPLTAYVCCQCFRHIMGPIVPCGGS